MHDLSRGGTVHASSWVLEAGQHDPEHIPKYGNGTAGIGNMNGAKETSRQYLMQQIRTWQLFSSLLS
jgi:hypothetical protein